MIQSSGPPALNVRGARASERSRRRPVALARLAHVVLENVEEIGAEGGAVGVERGAPLLVAGRRGEGLGDDRLRTLGRLVRLCLHLNVQRRQLAGAPSDQILLRPPLMARARAPAAEADNPCSPSRPSPPPTAPRG